MPGPWERYQQRGGPWQKYASTRTEPMGRGEALLAGAGLAASVSPAPGLMGLFGNSPAQRGFRQGASAGFSDEIAGATAAGLELASGGDLTDAERTRRMTTAQGRQDLAVAREEAPVSTFVGEVGGALAGVPAGAFKVGATLATNAGARSLPTLGRLAAQGTAGGVVSGALDFAGRAEGGLGERAVATGEGAAFGGATGGVMGPVSSVAGRVLQAGARRIPLLGRLGAQNRAALGLGQALEADNVDAATAERLAREFNQRSGITTPGGAGSVDRRAVAQGEAQGRSAATLLDLAHRNGWDNTVTYLESAAGRQGPGRRLVEAIRQVRQLQRGDRVRGRLDALNPSAGGAAARPSLDETVEAIGTIAARNARPLYEQLDQLPIQLSPEIEAASRTGIVQDGMAAAVSMARRGNIQNTAARAALEFIEEGQDGLYYIRNDAPASTWDMVKKGMDAVLFNDRRAPRAGQALSNFERGQARQVYWALVREIDNQTGGAYAAARSSWGGDQAAAEAAEHATGAWSVRGGGGHQAWMAEARNWGNHERFAAATAAYDMLVDQASEGSVTAFANKLNPRSQTYNPQLVARLRAIFGAQIDDVMAGVLDEAERLPAINAVSSRTGSPTARRMGAQGEFEDQVADATMDIAMGAQNPIAGAVSVARRIIAGTRGVSPQEAQEVMRLALDPYTPSGVRQVLARAALVQAQRQGGPPIPRETLLALQAASSARNTDNR